MLIERWPSSGRGRSRTSAYGELVWTVETARNPAADFAAQTADVLALLDTSLSEAGSDRQRMLSVQVLLTDIGNRPAFDAQWCEWLGDDPQGWPQRAVSEAKLAPGLLLEVVVTAARLPGMR